MNETIPTPSRVAIAVAIVEDNHRMRDSFAALLNEAPGMRCVSAFATGEEAVREVPQQKPDVALVDIHLPGMNGIECVARLKARLPELQILMLTRYERSDIIFSSLRAGASGYLLKSAVAKELIDAVAMVHAGGAPMTMQIARKVIEYFHRIPSPQTDFERLTSREQELLFLMSRGYCYREIAEELGISVSTVRSHAHSIYMKLHVRSRDQAISLLPERNSGLEL